MANLFTPLSAKVRSYARNLGVQHKLKLDGFGSFLSVRIEDPDASLSVASAQSIVTYAGHVFNDAGLSTNLQPMQGISYTMGGVVANWERK